MQAIICNETTLIAGTFTELQTTVFTVIKSGNHCKWCTGASRCNGTVIIRQNSRHIRGIPSRFDLQALSEGQAKLPIIRG